MPIIATLKPMVHGAHFRAAALRTAQPLIDPYLGVDHAWMSAPTFPPHRHAGMSAVSYVFPDSETGVRNQDSIGTRNLIRPGGLHWMAAGRGIVHEEVPDEPGKTVHSLQIFVDLPPARRDMDPQALVLEPQDVPVLRTGDAVVRVLAGGFGGLVSPLRPPTDVTMLDVSLRAGAALDVPVHAGSTVFLLPILGSAEIDGHEFDHAQPQLPVYPADAGVSTIAVRAGEGGARFMVFGGVPLHAASAYRTSR